MKFLWIDKDKDETISDTLEIDLVSELDNNKLLVEDAKGNTFIVDKNQVLSYHEET